MLGGRINLTNICNLNCRYCYVNKCDNIINIKTCETFINKLMELPKFNKVISLFGGEPSLCGVLIKRLINEYKPKGIVFTITSNGYFIFDQYNEFLLRNLNGINISLEGCEESLNQYRGLSGLSDKINTLCDLDYSIRKKITVNISLNSVLMSHIDEFINNYNKLKANDINIHIYSIHGEDGITSIEEFYIFLLNIKDRCYDLFKLIIGGNDSKVDTEFLCSFDNSITLNYDGSLIDCINGMNVYGHATDLNSYENIYKQIINNHKSLFKGCNNCVVPIGLCQISCPVWIKNMLNDGKYEELDLKCSLERVKQFLRDEEEKIGY